MTLAHYIIVIDEDSNCYRMNLAHGEGAAFHPEPFATVSFAGNTSPCANTELISWDDAKQSLKDKVSELFSAEN